MSLNIYKTRGWIAYFLRCTFLSYGMRLTVKITPAPFTWLWGESYYACEHVLQTVQPHPFLLYCLLSGLSIHCFRIETHLDAQRSRSSSRGDCFGERKPPSKALWQVRAIASVTRSTSSPAPGTPLQHPAGLCPWESPICSQQHLSEESILRKGGL